MTHDVGKVCVCVATHNPNPMELHRHHIRPKANGGTDDPENLIWLCPTTHTNIHELMRWWFSYAGRPHWEIEKHYGPYVRRYARLGYELSVIPA